MRILLLIDLQQGMCDPNGIAGRNGLAAQVKERKTLEAAASALSTARGGGIEICHIRLAFEQRYTNRSNQSSRFDEHERAGRFMLGSTETQFCSEVQPRPEEAVVNKGAISPFAATGLLDSLAARGIRELFLAGVATHLAVESAAREASDRGFRVTILEDACASSDADIHEHAISTTIPAFATVASTNQFRSQT